MYCYSCCAAAAAAADAGGAAAADAAADAGAGAADDDGAAAAGGGASDDGASVAAAARLVLLLLPPAPLQRPNFNVFFRRSLSCLVLPVSSLMCASFSSWFVGRVESAAAYHTLYAVSYRPQLHVPPLLMVLHAWL